MTRLAFDCDTCRHRLTVPADRAGKAVRCPKCQAVMLAPAAGSPDAAGTGVVPDLRGAASKADEADSIFSDADGDGESLFEDVDAPRKPVFPTAADDAQATIRVPGVPPPPTATTPFTPQPLTLHGNGAATLPKAVPAPIPAVPVTPTPVETTNPFRRMVDEVMDETRGEDERDAADAERDGEDESAVRPAGGPAWKTWALVVVSVYALLATAAAVWGWTRTPPEKTVPVKK